MPPKARQSPHQSHPSEPTQQTHIAPLEEIAIICDRILSQTPTEQCSDVKRLLHLAVDDYTNIEEMIRKRFLNILDELITPELDHELYLLSSTLFFQITFYLSLPDHSLVDEFVILPLKQLANSVDSTISITAISSLCHILNVAPSKENIEGIIDEGFILSVSNALLAHHDQFDRCIELLNKSTSVCDHARITKVLLNLRNSLLTLANQSPNLTLSQRAYGILSRYFVATPLQTYVTFNFVTTDPNAWNIDKNLLVKEGPLVESYSTNRVLSAGVWRCDLFLKTVTGNVMLGLVRAGRTLPPSGQAMGKDRYSAYFSLLGGTIRHAQRDVRGNQECEQGQLASVEIDMTGKVRTATLFINDERQPVILRNIPNAVYFAITLSGQYDSVEVWSIKELPQATPPPEQYTHIVVDW
ncbi:hypothetical protein BLNAU_12540 [Blattamonas nauphoetae]|uniref:SPRY domain-containing protein n=1 Tax=Blattamonas nauphoetae TaxID=2049346 RepID=A0ABQ9XM43_9EUKA|nr:hypothetical protein BLNAU_12540 [Blattamonas nauphoetae]